MKPTSTSYYQSILPPDDYQKFIDILKTPNRKALRVNTLKISVAELQEIAKEHEIKLTKIPWTEEGFWYEFKGQSESFSLGNTNLYDDALVYIQDASSLLPVEVLDPKPGEIILDLAAAPGGKTTFIAQKMQNEGLIVANEVVHSRAYTLQKMLEKYGVFNTAITSYDSSFFAKFYPNFFDKILLDAPCSGEGMRMRGEDIRKNFSFNIIKFSAKRQKRIIKNAFLALKENGILVYSTCALAVEENEEVVDYLLQEFADNIELIPINIAKAPGATEFMNKKFDQRLSGTIRLWPQLYNTNGFYVAGFRKLKKSDILPAKLQPNDRHFHNWQIPHAKRQAEIYNILRKDTNMSLLPELDHYHFVEHRKKDSQEVWIQSKLVYKINRMKILFTGKRLI